MKHDWHNPTHVYINKNFLIRVKEDGVPGTRLYSAEPYERLINDPELSGKHFEKAINSRNQREVIKLRRGLEIVFVCR